MDLIWSLTRIAHNEQGNLGKTQFFNKVDQIEPIYLCVLVQNEKNLIDTIDRYILIICIFLIRSLINHYKLLLLTRLFLNFPTRLVEVPCLTLL